MEKRLLSLLISLIIIVAGLPAVALQAQTVPILKKSGSISENIDYKIFSNGSLEIIGTGAMPNFSSCLYPEYYSYKNSITSIVVDNGITSVGDYAFAKLENVTKCSLSSTVEYIGRYAFYSDYSLEGCDLTNSSVKVIDEYAFYNCSLKSISNCISLTRIEKGAYANNELSSINLAGSSVEYVGEYAFSGNYYTQSLYLNNNITTFFSNALKNCTSIQKVSIPKGMVRFNGSALKDTEFFNKAANWSNNMLIVDKTLLYVKKTDASSTVSVPEGIEYISSYAFESGFTTLNIPASVKKVGGVFDGFSNITIMLFFPPTEKLLFIIQKLIPAHIQ